MSSESGAKSFLVAAAAASCSCVISNPMEVVKTRMQLQGELEMKSATKARAYRNAAHAFYKICRDEGLRGIQSGLGSGILYQVMMNGTRLGLYKPLQRKLGANSTTDSPTAYFLKNLTAGATSGGLGAIIGSPFFLVKARLQQQSTAHQIRPEGAEVFRYKGTLDAFRSIHATEGWKGFVRGIDGAVPRVMVGSAAQLSSYSSCKSLVLSTGWFKDDLWCYTVSSLCAGLVVTTCMQPFDVVSTRLYSQTSGSARYSGPFDCFSKSLKAEVLSWPCLLPSLKVRGASVCEHSFPNHACMLTLIDTMAGPQGSVQRVDSTLLAARY
ncbi:unnamed protein product [Chrysoparadoxa australica]